MNVTTVPTREGYDRWSEIYDEEENPLILLEERWIGPLLADFAGERVVELGCGTGRHTAALARSGARVTALDFSSGMLARAKARPEAGLVDWVVADLARPLPLPDAAFPRALSALVLEHLTDPDAFFREVARVLAPGGAVVVSVMHPAMMLKGISARFTDPQTGQKIGPESHAHDLARYVMAVVRAGLTLEHLSEHAIDDELAARSERAVKYLGWPMLVLLRARR